MLFYIHQLDFENERGTGRDDVANTPIPIGQPRGDDQLTAGPGTHVQQPLVPAGDHLTLTQRELEGLAAVQARVELGAVHQSTYGQVTNGQVGHGGS